MRILLASLIAFVSITAHAQDRYRFELDLITTQNDQVRVSMWPPKLGHDTVTVVFPVTVPGTYETHNWWKLVRNLTAYDSKLTKLPVSRPADSQFVITNARDLNFISYELDDSFDDSTSGISVFPPAGTGFEHDSVFILNHGGIVCYIEGKQKTPFQIIVKRPKHLWGGSGLNIARVSDTLDTYLAETYDQLVDNPVVYSWPDTATYTVNGVSVLVHCVHAGRDTVAPAYARELARLTKTIGRFLPSMPVSRYAFLFYLWNGDPTKVRNPRGMGALEHGNSSFYFLPFQKRPMGLGEVAIHEFMHILVPLNLHSEEIDRFDFRNPRMSQHLWLYEGATEYFATLAPLHDSTVKEQSFRGDIQSKLRSINDSPAFSWTEFSRDVLSKEGQDRYPIVYEYGAVNAMLLDIVIRESTNQQMSLLSTIYKLMPQYGPSRSFHDDSLFAIIGRATTPAVREYLEKHVKGAQYPDFEKLFGRIGWKYTAERVRQVPGYGIKATFVMEDGEPAMVIKTDSESNPLGARSGDKLLKVNGLSLREAMSSADGQRTLMKLRDAKIGDPLQITVLRDGKETELSGTAAMVDRKEYNIIEDDPSATPEQQAFRKALFYR